MKFDNISKDELWKGAIEDFINPFIHYFYEEYIHLIDWKKGFEFLDTELNNIVKGLTKGKRTADKLVKAYLINGNEKWFLIHVEVQSQPDVDLNERMFTMYYRLRDKYKVEVAPLAILAYTNAKNIGIYKEKFWGMDLKFKYKTYKIVDEVEKGNINYSNIFSLIIESVYTDIKYKEDDQKKFDKKIQILDNFLGRKATIKEYYEMLNFISVFIRLSSKYELSTQEYIINKTNSKNMGLKELFKKTLEKEVSKYEKEVSKYEKEVNKYEKEVSKKDDLIQTERNARIKETEARMKDKEKAVCKAFLNGISVSLISNIVDLPSKDVKTILKRNGHL